MSTEIKDWNGFKAVYVSNSLGEAVVTLHGAHLVSFAPKGSREILWMSAKSNFVDGKSIRGGIPVCWPWFGPAAQPAHGLARLTDWMITATEELSDGTTALNLAFVPKQADYAFLLANMRIVVGKTLSVTLETTNNGDREYLLSEALHTYFNISDIEKISVRGLSGVSYTDTLDNQEKIQKGDISFSSEVDRIYHTSGAAEISDPLFRRSIRIEKSGSASTVVWNPWIEKSKKMADYGDEEYHSMVCVETANARVDSIPLKPGESHKTFTRISEIR